ncbi:hypothetical protein BWK60_01925 [Flavobacterium covae]|uniref:hypothetical protein n=1 Tax=Flavobacterium covae TaxID=2906076 RepID=UPI000B4CA644|nr:hypothetical protein [Flavobacterium covae]OWP87771.1 hypothetical protein BWK60_01925 [Flavobacterium covae]
MLEIRKKERFIFWHIDSQKGAFALGKYSFSLDDDYFQVIEEGHAKRNQYHLSEIIVFDDTTGSGIPETFTNSIDFVNRLRNLGYGGFDFKNAPVQNQLHFITFSGTANLSNYTDWYSNSKTAANVFTPNYVPIVGITPANNFADDVNICPYVSIPFKHKIHSCFAHFRANALNVSLEFCLRSFSTSNPFNDGISASAINSTIIARKKMNQKYGGQQPNVKLSDSELNNSYIGKENTFLKFYFKNISETSAGNNFGFNFTAVFERID